MDWVVEEAVHTWQSRRMVKSLARGESLMQPSRLEGPAVRQFSLFWPVDRRGRALIFLRIKHFCLRALLVTNQLVP